jgi:hypothetical protein
VTIESRCHLIAAADEFQDIQPNGSNAAVAWLHASEDRRSVLGGNPCFATAMSHINQVVADTQQWEQTAAFRLEMAVKHGLVLYYAKNDHLGLMTPYEYLGVEHNYLPDYLVRDGKRFDPPRGDQGSRGQPVEGKA